MLALTRAWPQQLLQVFMVLLRIERDAPVPDLRGNKSTGRLRMSQQRKPVRVRGSGNSVQLRRELSERRGNKRGT